MLLVFAAEAGLEPVVDPAVLALVSAEASLSADSAEAALAVESWLSPMWCRCIRLDISVAAAAGVARVSRLFRGLVVSASDVAGLAGIGRSGGRFHVVVLEMWSM